MYKVKVKVKYMLICPACDGKGVEECPECAEIGRMHLFQPIELGTPDCIRCKGFGYIICHNCEGQVKVRY